MSKRVTYTCMICRVNKVICTVASNGDGDGETGFGPNRPVCKNWECRQEMSKQLAEHEEWQREKYKDQRIKDVLQEIKRQMDAKVDLTVDFENSEIPEEKKEICRKYVKACQEIEDMEKRKKKLQEKGSNDKSNKGTEERCDDCGLVINGKRFYKYWDGKNGSGISCESCTKSKQKQRENEDSGSRQNRNIHCNHCLQKIRGVYYENKETGRIRCESCKSDEEENFNQNDQNHSPNSSNESKKNFKSTPVVSKIPSHIVSKIKRGEYVDIDSLNLSEEEKEELRRIQNNSKVTTTSYEKYWGKIIGGIFVFLTLILLILVVRNRRAKKRKKRT